MTSAAALLDHDRTNFKHLVRVSGVNGEARERLEEALGRLTEKGEPVETRAGEYRGAVRAAALCSERERTGGAAGANSAALQHGDD